MSESNERFSGQSAFVTGSATGIGESCARKLAAGGAAVAVCDFNEEGGRRVAGEIEKSGGQAVFIKADLTDWEQTRAAVEDFKNRHGRLDILVHSAGGFPKYVSLLDCPVDAWESVVNSNLKSMFHLLKVAAPLMIEGGYGRFVSLSSMAARSGTNPNPPHYTAAKGGVLALTDDREAEPTDGVTLATAQFKAGKGPVFSVSSKEKTFSFHCKDEAERDEWLGALLEAKLDARNVPAGGEEAETCVVQ